MKIKITSHAVERSLERIGMTGVEFINLLRYELKEKDLLHEKPKNIWVSVSGKRIKLTMIRNKIITIWKP